MLCPSSDRFKAGWEKEMSIQIPEERWEKPRESFEHAHKYSVVGLKTPHRLHVKVKINHIYPSFYYLVACPTVASYWPDTFNSISRND